MNRSFIRIVSGAASVLLAFVGLFITSPPTQALSGAAFKPGLIISDTVFFDYGTMSAARIQTFLESKVSVCTDNDGGPKCLRNYTETVVGSVAIKSNLHDYSLHLCDTVPASNGPIAASEIIYEVAVACKINPQVLLVTLQKEQGLVSAADPTTYMYKAAMGYGCPDSAPQVCGQDSNSTSRLFWQLYRAAWQMRYYGHPKSTIKYYRPGAVHNIAYHPSTSCGKKGVYIESQATANLYYYTPYQPNAAALNNLGGTGDGCSAYGNRNFWRYFWSWFGNPTVGVNLINSSANPTGPVYLVNLEKNIRYRIPNGSIFDDYKNLGAVGAHSDAFVNSFTDGGDLGSIVADKAGNRYLISTGAKFKLADVAQATSLGLNWLAAPVLTDPQVSAFQNLVFGKSPTTGAVYLLQGTTKAPVGSADLLRTLNGLGATGNVLDSILAGFTEIAPVTDLVQDSAGVRYNIQDGKKILIPTEGLASALGRQWSTATVIATAFLDKLDNAAFVSGPTANSTYFLSGGTKHLTNTGILPAMANFGATAKVSADFLNRFPTGAALGSLLKSATDTWYIAQGQKFKITSAQATAIGKDYASAITATDAQLGTIPTPILMKATANGTTYLVDDYVDRYPLAGNALDNYANLGPTGLVPTAYLNSFTTKTDPGQFVNCSTDGQHYYLYGTKRYRVANAATAKAIAPAIFTETDVFGSLPSLTTAELSKYPVASTTSYVTTYTKSASESYIIDNGVRHEVLDAESLAAGVPNAPAVSVLGPSAFASLPLGVPVVADNSMFKNSTRGTYGIFSAGTFYPMDASFYNEVKASAGWHFSKSTGSLTAASIATLNQGPKVSPFGSNSGVGYLLSASGKQPISDIQNVVANPPAIATAIFNRIDASTTPALTTPFIAKAQSATAPSYLVASGSKRQVYDATETTSLLPMVSNPNVQIWPQSAIDALRAGTTVLAPGTAVKMKETGKYYLIDGFARGLKVSLATAKVIRGSAPRVVKRAQLSGYTLATALDWQKVICGGQAVVLDSGTLALVDTNAAAQWPGVGTVLDQKTCLRFTSNPARLGTLVSSGGSNYLAVGKKLRLIRTLDEFNALAAGKTPTLTVSPLFVASVPAGNPTSYVVVKKDTLKALAKKFKTTLAILKSLNRLTSDKLAVGKVLLLP